MKHSLARKLLFCTLSILCGWIAAFGMQPVSLWPALFIGLSGLYYLYSKTQTGPQAYAAGFFFAIGYFVTGLWWIGNALLVEGNEFAWVWPISVIGLPTLLGLFTGLYLAIARILSNPKTLSGFFCFAFFLTISEWTRGHAFTGFPWNLYGYVWADYLAMAQGYFLFGSFGMTFLTVIWAATAGWVIVTNAALKQKLIYTLPTLSTLLELFAWGTYRLDNNPTTFDTKNMVVVVQPNIEQNMKWDPDVIQDNFLKLNSLSKGAPVDENHKPDNIFVVWPETAISPAVYTKTENMDAIGKMLRGYSADAYLVTGVLLRMEKDGEVIYGNSVSLLNRDLEILDTYSKSHLVPFGEYIPFQKWIPLTPVAAFKGFERGKGTTTVSHANLPSFSPLVCYEIIFPDKVVSTKGERPRWIVNVTNDGWYGNSAGPYQHFAQTRIRAIEEGVPVIRSANTGISGVIDPYGRIIEKADIYQEASLVSALPKSIAKPFGAWPWALQPLMFLASIALMFAFLRRKTRP